MPLIRPRNAVVLLAIVGGVVMTGAARADMVQLYAGGSLLLGADWPIGEADPLGFIDRCSEANDPEKRMIKGERAAELIGL
jgi:hypothetical protein